MSTELEKVLNLLKQLKVDLEGKVSADKADEHLAAINNKNMQHL